MKKTLVWFKTFLKNLIHESYELKKKVRRFPPDIREKSWTRKNFCMLHIPSCSNRLSGLLILIHTRSILQIQSLSLRDAVASLL